MLKTEYGISQNFLTSRKTIDTLLDRTTLNSSDTVLEIGAGKGHITRALAARCNRVIAWEIDPALARRLSGTLPENVRLIEGDFLRAPIPRRCKVFANIPFNRTTDIIRRLTEAPQPPQEIWLIVEKGAAMRFSGAGRESAASLGLKPWWEVRIRQQLPRSAFHPMPSVDCALLELKRKAEPDIPLADRRLWQRFVRQGLQEGLCRMLTPRQIAAALRQAQIPMSATLRYVQWLCLFRWMRRK